MREISESPQDRLSPLLHHVPKGGEGVKTFLDAQGGTVQRQAQPWMSLLTEVACHERVIKCPLFSEIIDFFVFTLAKHKHEVSYLNGS